ncbi:hypothetical protein PFISCL1PPCAC_16282, partial [Pristionchus fissidentatus]
TQRMPHTSKESDSEYSVDEIVDHIRRGKLLERGSKLAYDEDQVKNSKYEYVFRARWVGWSSEDDTWQTFESFADKSMPKIYARTNGLELQRKRRDSSEEIRRRVNEIERAYRIRRASGGSSIALSISTPDSTPSPSHSSDYCYPDHPFNSSDEDKKEKEGKRKDHRDTTHKSHRTKSNFGEEKKKKKPVESSDEEEEEPVMIKKKTEERKEMKKRAKNAVIELSESDEEEPIREKKKEIKVVKKEKHGDKESVITGVTGSEWRVSGLKMYRSRDDMLGSPRSEGKRTRPDCDGEEEKRGKKDSPEAEFTQHKSKKKQREEEEEKRKKKEEEEKRKKKEEEEKRKKKEEEEKRKKKEEEEKRKKKEEQ